MHETGRNITDGVLSLVNDIPTLRIEHAAYFSLIDRGIQNITAAVVSVAADVFTIRDISYQVARA